MAKYRQVHVDFWQDGFVLDLTPEEKYFFLYLMTNSKTTQCGIYELPKRIIETETGYNRETVDKLLTRFIDYRKIQYHLPTKEVMLVNWAKYNFINSPKVKKCIEKELESVKYRAFVELYVEQLKQYGYRIDTVCIDLGEEEEQEEEEEKEQEQEANVFAFYENNFGVLNPFVSQSLDDWVKDVNTDVVIEAMKRALKQQKKWNYAEGILKQWANNNIKTLDDVLAADNQFKKKKDQPVNSPKRNNQHLDYMRQLRGEA